MEKTTNTHTNIQTETADVSSGKVTPVKGTWVKPEIVAFEPVTVTRGIAYRTGDGISNLS